MKFKLNNEERKYFGLNTIQKNWDEMLVPVGRYDKNPLIIYFDKNKIVKQIVATDSYYYENDINIETENRIYLLPKTPKGKKSKITISNITNKYSSQGIYFTAGKHETAIANYTTQTNFYSTYFQQIQIKNAEQFEKWKNDYIKHSDVNYLSELNAFKKAKRQKSKYKKGDYFSFKISRNEFGYGRILEDLGKLQKQNKINEGSYLRCFLGPKLLICLYAYKSKHKTIDTSELRNSIQLPSQFISDNNLFYGEFYIFESTPIEENELDFPIKLHYHKLEYLKLEWGELVFESKDEIITSPITNLFRKESEKIGMPFYDGETSLHLNLNYKTLETIIKEKKLSAFYKHQKKDIQMDLRNPKYKTLKKQLFNIFKLDKKLGYWENLKKFTSQ